MGHGIKVLRGRFVGVCGCIFAFMLFVTSASGVPVSVRGAHVAEHTVQPDNPTQGALNRSEGPTDHYTLTPGQRAKAVAYAHARYFLYFFGTALTCGIYGLFWRAGIALYFRNWASRFSRHHFVQCLIFAPLFFVSVSLLQIPFAIYSGFTLERRFGLSTQSIASWLADWAKDLGITVLAGVFVVWILYAVIRRSPRRWWFYFWIISAPLTIGLILIQPVVIDPLFFKFTPLEKTQPALTVRIEAMLHHAGLEIPASRIFVMDASTKTNAVNAYVNGVGLSKRVVIWDTTLRLMDEDETLLVLGHEMGHYVLNHVVKGFVLFELGALAAFGIGFIIVERMIRCLKLRSNFTGPGDLASLPLLLLVITMLSFFSSPIYCGVSRYIEHQADQFGLEVAYGVVRDPNAVEVRSLQILGEQDLEDPDPSPFIKFWLYTHPPLDERIRFAASYKPWADGKPLELVHPK